MKTRKLTEYTCQKCEQTFMAPYSYLPRKFCSQECFKSSSRHYTDRAGVRPHKVITLPDVSKDPWKGNPMTITTCAWCKKEFTHPVNRTRVGRRFCSQACSLQMGKKRNEHLFSHAN